MRLTQSQLAELRRLLSLSTDIAVMPASIVVALLADYEQLLKIAEAALEVRGKVADVESLDAPLTAFFAPTASEDVQT